MTLHLIRTDLRRHRWLYLLLAALLFALPVLTSRLATLSQDNWTQVLLSLLAPIGFVALGLVLSSTPWLDDRAFWRTRPITTRQLFAARTLSICLVVLLPLLAAMLIVVLPHHLGSLATTVGMLQWTAIVVAFSMATTAAHALASDRSRQKHTPYFAAFLAPMLSGFAFSWCKFQFSLWHRTPAEALGGGLIGLLFVAIGTAAAWVLVGRFRRSRAALWTLFLSTLIFPWIAGTLRLDIFPLPAPEKRTIGIEILDLEQRSKASPVRFTELKPGEFFSPAQIDAAWENSGQYTAYQWPKHTRHRASNYRRPPGQTLRPLEKNHGNFAAAADLDAWWGEIRRQIPAHDAWHLAEPAPQIFEPIKLPSTGFSFLDSRGWIYRLKPLPSVTKLIRGELDYPALGRLDLIETTADGSSVNLTLRLTRPKPPLHRELGSGWPNNNDPPEFWAVLFHPPTRSAYAAHGWPVTMFGSGPAFHLAQTQKIALNFPLNTLEIALLGTDPQKILQESSLHLFRTENLGWATGKLDE